MSNKPNVDQSQSFGEMSTASKLLHIGKVCLFFMTFGFAFPSILDG